MNTSESTKNIHFIHLSDIHFRLSWPEEIGKVLSSLKEDLSTQIRSIGSGQIFLIISGDIVQAGEDAGLYNGFISEFDSFLNDNGITKDKRIIVPGNHDASQKLIKPKWDILHSLINSETHQSEERFNRLVHGTSNPYGSLFPEYISFESRFTTQGIGNCDRGGRGWMLPCGIGVYCLNTAMCSMGGYKGPKDNYYDETHLSIDTRSIYDWCQNDGKAAKVKILVMHHPIDDLSAWSRKELRSVINEHFAICLFGHRHDQDVSCNAGARSHVVMCQAPALFSRKSDHLGYAIVSVDSAWGPKTVSYRQLSKDAGFVSGSYFSGTDSGVKNIPRTLAPGEDEVSCRKWDFIKKTLENRLDDSLKSFTDDPVIFVDPLLSTKDGGQRNEFKFDSPHNLDVSKYFQAPFSCIIRSPPQFGLTCLAHYMVLSAWKQQVPALWIYINSLTTTSAQFQNSVVRYLEDLQCDPKSSSVGGIIIDSVDVNNEKCKKLLLKVAELYRGKCPIVLMNSTDESGSAISPFYAELGIDFKSLFLLALPQERVRRMVSEYNETRRIGDDDIVLKRVLADFNALNIHRSPHNCLTLLKACDGRFDENPVNRTEVINRILFVLFNSDQIPSYCTKPDLKDCEYIIGNLCERLIRDERQHFSREEFIAVLSNVCKVKKFDVDIDILFKILHDNNIIVEHLDGFAFKSRYWIHYFAAHRMLKDKEFCDFILSERRYASHPELIEFYTGIDRERNDVLGILSTDIRRAINVVREKCGLPQDFNPLGRLSYKATNEQLDQMQKRLTDDLASSKLPDEIKDRMADKEYNPSRPYTQSLQKFFDEYSLRMMIGAISSGARALRNSDYADPKIKKELLDAILDGWEQLSVVLFVIAPILAKSGQAHMDDAGFELSEDFDRSKEQSFRNVLIKILRSVPYNIIRWHCDDLYSPKMATLYYEKLAELKRPIPKHELVLLLIEGKPKGWVEAVRKYLEECDYRSAYVHDVYSQLLNHYRYALLSGAQLRDTQFLLKATMAKINEGNKPLGIDRIEKIQDNSLPSRE